MNKSVDNFITLIGLLSAIHGACERIRDRHHCTLIAYKYPEPDDGIVPLLRSILTEDN